MSHYDVEAALHRLEELGVDVSTLHQDYYKIPLENIDLSKVEQPEPKKGKVISKHTVIVDSRQRNYSIYPTPSEYLIELMEPHRNVERIELIAAMMPKTEYNINTENNLLLVTINGQTNRCYLTEGQYVIGSNSTGGNYVSDGSSSCVYGLIAEMNRVLMLVDPNFNCFLATMPQSAGGTGNNASVLNRIVITNDNTPFSIDFTNNQFTSGSPFRILGFNKTIYTSAVDKVKIYGRTDTGECSSADLNTGIVHTIGINAISSCYDYNLKDDPKYIIMQLDFGNKSADRIESSDIATNQKFAVIIYDANEPDNIYTYNGVSIGPVQLKVQRPPGNLKALKGSDFDKKILTFEPPITVENFKISFYKYDNTLYNFHNREHLLTFELDIADYDPKYRY